MLLLRRRAWLGAAAATLLPWEAFAKSSNYELRDIQVSGSNRLGKRFTMLVPKNTGGRKVPLLVALHGLGETGNQRTGAHAWVQRYGLGTTYDRLCKPPIKPVYQAQRHWNPARLKQVNAELSKTPFRGFAIVCPYTPNVYKMPRKTALDDYADWLVTEVLPRARKEVSTWGDAAHTSLDGCSLGGYVGIEVFLRKPRVFGAWGAVQGAFGAFRTDSYAKAIAAIIKKHGKRRIHLETSTTDAFRKVNLKLSKALTKVNVAHDFIMPPGPHNQPFLRDSGTLEMLLWHDRLPR